MANQEESKGAERRMEIALNALNDIAQWDRDGYGCEEPWSARRAREAIGMIKELDAGPAAAAPKPSTINQEPSTP